jgi:serine protease Do
MSKSLIAAALVLAMLAVKPSWAQDLMQGAASPTAQPPTPPPPPDPAQAAPPSLPDASANGKYRPFGFSRVIAKIPVGTVYGKPHGGVFCLPSGARTWNLSSSTPQAPQPYQDALRSEMKAAGFTVDGDPDNVFESAVSTSDIQLAAVITSLTLDYCEPYIGSGNTAMKGTVALSVTWEVYSTIKKQMLAKIDTSGSFEVKELTPGGPQALISGAFKENVRALIANARFKAAMSATPTLSGADAAKPTSQSPIALLGAGSAKPRPVSEALSSVVMILAGDVQGSGYLVSTNGLLLTDQHVVGDAKYVKVRWSDGTDGLGEVIRTDKAHDVALVKTDPHGRLPLKLRREPLQPGDTVYAIGAPLDPRFQSTVTRGVVSAYRTFDGLNFIQSDTPVNPGSSGGPLLDEKGEVVATTEAGYGVPGVPSNINLFIPVGDALSFLSATLN